VYTGSRLRAGTTSTKLNLTSTGSQSVIDLCNNSNIDISASTIFLNGKIVSEGGIQVGSGIFGGTITKSATAHEIVIDPFGIDGTPGTQDASGQVTIMGDLVVRGNMTTVYSTQVDISDILLTLASGSGSTAALGNGGGIKLGDGYASLLYDSSNNRWKSNISLDISGALTVSSAVTNTSKITAFNGIDYSANVLPLNNWSQLPVTMSTFTLKTDALSAAIATTSPNDWVDAPGYVVSRVVLSPNSFIKMEFKVNYISSPEADQTLSFQVLKSITGNSPGSYTTVFSDISLGSNMGVTFNNVYYGTFIDDLAGATLTSGTVYYKLQFRRDCPTNDTISTPFGIVASSGNYISLQELYEPNA